MYDDLALPDLELFGPLAPDDKNLLDKVVSHPRTVEAHQDLVREGERSDNVRLVISGFAHRYKLVQEGSRQIFAYLLPGDFCDLNVFILNEMDHSIATLSQCEIVDIPRARILELTTRPDIARALWWATLVDEATLREWVVNLGARDAETRIAHLLCELHLRLKSVGLADGGRFELPITQSELGDTMGLSSVHVNRSLQALRHRNLITFRSGYVVIFDVKALQKLSGFNPNYLHLKGGRRDKS